MIDDHQIQAVLSLEENLTDKAARLVDLANAAGGRDNITVALVEVR
jgi:protein phosphatase